MPRKARAGSIFVHEDTGFPVSIHLDLRLSLQIRQEWTKKIQDNGGTVVRDAAEAEYVVCSKTHNKSLLQIGYAASKDAAKRKITVHYIDFLEACLDAGRLVVIKEKPKGMSGRARQRAEFTDEEIENLCRYIAVRMPESASGGRRGDNLYKELVELGKVNPEYAWVNRHPWQAWRNKYNKNVRLYDAKIDFWVPIVNPDKVHRYDADRRVNTKGYASSEESEEESGNEGDGLDKTEDNEEDDSQPGPPSGKGKGRAPPEDDGDDDQRSDQNENEGEADDKTPPPRDGRNEEANDSWEVIDLDDFQAPVDFAEPQVDSAPTPRSVERHARFASNTEPKRAAVEKSRRLSFEAPSPAKRPRLSAESATSTGSQPLRRGARLPPGKMPGATAESDPEDDEDEGKTDSEAMDVAHSLFSEDEAELNQDEDLEGQPEPEAGEDALSGLSEARPPTIPSAASSTVFPISTDRTLVVTASPRRTTGVSPRKMARLSSASRKEEYIILDEAQELEAKVLDVITVEDDDEEVLGEGEVEQDQEMEDEAGESVSGRRSPSVEVVSYQPSPKVVEAPVPAVQTSRNRRRTAERQAQRPPAPTRVTRSRSQSVEPTEFVSLPSKPSKRKGKGRANVFEPEPEIMEEVMEEVDEEPITGKETLAEEEDVMNIITNEEDFSNISNATSAAQQGVASGSSKTISRQASPEEPSSDDEQVIRRIAAQHVQLEGAVVRKGPRKSNAFVDAFKAGMAATMNTPAARPALPSHLLANPTRSISAHQRASEKKRTPKPYKVIYTPTHVPGGAVQPPSRNRAVSTASSSNETAESIPMPGTRAKAFKVKMEEEEKYTPYTPPRGTRASLYTQDRQTARSSKRR